MTDYFSAEQYELDLTSMAHGGNALGRLDGIPIFVPFGIAGERVRVRIVEDKGRFARAALTEVLTPSSVRVIPRCKHFGRCGGCHFQHIDYAAQLAFKRDIVMDQLARIGGFREVEVRPVIGSSTPWNYRTHVTFQVTDDGALGFVTVDGDRVMPIQECHIIRPALQAMFQELNFSSIDTIDRVRLQVGSAAEDVMIALSTTDGEAPEVEVTLPASVSYLDPDGYPEVLVGEDAVTYVIHDRTFHVRAGGFFQVNLEQAETLVTLVMERLALHGGETLLDLYSGVGLFTAFMAAQAAYVTAVEAYEPAVADADENLAEFDNVDLIEGPVEDVLAEMAEAEQPLNIDAAVVDPPRNGMEPAALDALAALRPQKIVYVSCDLATFARDAKRLAGKGYQLKHVQPVDMFPQTASIELVALLTLA